MADNIATREHEEAPEGTVTGQITKQIKSRPTSTINRKVQGHMDGAGGQPDLSESEQGGNKKFSEICTNPRKEGTSVKAGWQGGVLNGCNAEEEEESGMEKDIEKQEGKKET
eukprot:4806585-Pleurochrysis_carterae.AAC.1